MRKMAPILVVVLLMAVIVVITLSRARQQINLTVFIGNQDRQPVEMVLGHYQDTQCGMTIEQVLDSAQAVAPDGRTWFFDDVGCLAYWLKTNRLRDEMVLWVFSRDTGTWIDARGAWYSRSDRTPMEYGFGAYVTRQEGFVDFDTMVSMMLRGENLTNPYTRKELLGND